MQNPIQPPVHLSSFRQLRGDNRGVTTVEYVIVLVLVAVLAIGVWKKFGGSIQNQVTTSQKGIDGLQ
jgi:Flp pilus assembly pilin Flp